MRSESFEILPDFNKIDSYAELQAIVYRKKFAKSLECTDLITVRGIVLEDCERFAINLLCGDGTENSDVALHINPRFEQRYIVRNHRVGTKWGSEDTTGLYTFNLRRNEEFIIHIFVAEHEFLISVNEAHYCSFPFRINVRKITYIEVHGALRIFQIELKKTDVYPIREKTSVPSLQFDTPITNVEKLPYISKLEDQFVAGNEINIEGKLKLLPVAFYVNLQNSDAVWPHPLIPLHVNVRFAFHSGLVYIIRNSWQDGRWGSEERAVIEEFIPGRSVQLSIHCEHDSYTIWINKKLIAHYLFQLDNNYATHLYIEGDLHIKKIEHKKTVEELYTNSKFEMASDASVVQKNGQTSY